MRVSAAIMAHPARRHFVNELRRKMPGVPVVWDEKQDRWDTGRRAMLAFDPDADWHVVVQDDAIVCKNFLKSVRAALESVPYGFPVSFYTGKTRPYARQIKQAVEQAQNEGKTWLALRGPLWGVAVALPTSSIKQMITECDALEIPNYDMRMAEWFHERNLVCWYSLPSLVDHRVGDENPSLVPGRGASLARTAHSFVGADRSGLDVAWSSDALFCGDPAEPWLEDFMCTRCLAQQEDLAHAILHAFTEHGLGPVDFVASTPYHAETMIAVREQLPKPALGRLWIVDRGFARRLRRHEHTVVKRSQARRVIAADDGPFTIVGARRDLRYVGGRPAWSMTDGTSN